MRQPNPSWRAIALAATLAALGTARAQDQAGTKGDDAVSAAVKAKQAGEIRRGDPARWHQADHDRQARLQTLRKEIGAALAEASKACGAKPGNERAACLKEARATYERDLRNAPAQLDAAPQGALRTETVTTVATPAPPSSAEPPPAQPAAQPAAAPADQTR